MSRGVVESLAVTFALALAAEGAGQGLGDAAARERSRREQEKAPVAKTYTNESLGTGEAVPSEAQDEAAPGTKKKDAAPSGATAAADPALEEMEREREDRALAEREWRARFAEARAKLREAEARCWREVVRTEFYQGIPVQMKVKEFVETEEFRAAKRALADLGEEFRRTGLPPGWARE
jgi:hypothetical protein